VSNADSIIITNFKVAMVIVSYIARNERRKLVDQEAEVANLYAAICCCFHVE